MSLCNNPLTRDDLSPGIKEALTVFVTRSPLAVSLPMCLEHPDLFLSLSVEQQDMLINWAFKESLTDTANELCRIKFSSPTKPGKIFEECSRNPLRDFADICAQSNPMRNVLSNLKTAMDLLGIADEQLFIASDQLSDIATSANNSGLDIADIDLIDDASLLMQDVFDRLSNLSDYFRAKAGVV